MTQANFRRLALSLEGVEERSHMAHPDFRVGGRIFATMGYPKAGWAMVRLTSADQDAFVQMKSGAFLPVKGKWGEQGCTNVILSKATVPSVRAALRAAHESAVKAGRARGRKAGIE
ncbi:MAG TPA: hypothetical protein VMJ30_06450 [Gemmatimonadales bacterium]|nr:hypothetical protein [Gemmatimonadales bacterium]